MLTVRLAVRTASAPLRINDLALRMLRALGGIGLVGDAWKGRLTTSPLGLFRNSFVLFFYTTEKGRSSLSASVVEITKALHGPLLSLIHI